MAHKLDLGNMNFYHFKKILSIDRDFIKNHYHRSMFFLGLKTFCEVAEQSRIAKYGVPPVSRVMLDFCPSTDVKFIKAQIEQGVCSSSFIEDDFPVLKKFLSGEAITLPVQLSIVTEHSMIKCDETEIRRSMGYLFDIFTFPKTFLDASVKVKICRESLTIDTSETLVKEFIGKSSYQFIARFNVQMSLTTPFVPSSLETYKKPKKITRDENFLRMIGDLIINREVLQLDSKKHAVYSKPQKYTDAEMFFLEHVFKGDTLGIARVGQLLHQFGNAEQSQKTKIFDSFEPGRRINLPCGGNSGITLKLDHPLNAKDSYEHIQKLIEFVSGLKEALEAVNAILAEKGKTPTRVFMAKKAMDKIQMDPISFFKHADPNIANYAKMLLNGEQ